VELFKDISAGWLSTFNFLGPNGLDLMNGTSLNYQPFYAQQFYEVVTGSKLFPTLEEAGQQGGGATVVGHSLGGALAGYVGSLSGAETKVFNEMSYLGMAMNTAIDTFINQNISNGIAPLIQAMQQLVSGEDIDVEGFSFTPFVWPDADNITAFHMGGEVAGGARTAGPFLGFVADLFVSFVGKRIKALQSVAEEAIPDVETWGGIPDQIDALKTRISQAYGIYGSVVEQSNVVEIDSHAATLARTVSLHSQSLMVIDMYGDYAEHEDWKFVADERFKALFNSALANRTGLDDYSGTAGDADKMMTAIAYSAIEEGNKLFGDTGIRSMFNDLDELGQIYEDDTNLDPFLLSALQDNFPLTPTSIKQSLTNFSVAFAGALALNEVMHDADPDLDPREGVLTLNDDKNVLALDLSTKLWRDVMGETVTPYQDTKFKSEYFRQIAESNLASMSLIEVIEFLDEKARENWDGTGIGNFDRFHMRTQPDLGVVKLADRIYEVTEEEGPNVYIDLYVGLADQENEVWDSQGNDYVIGGSMRDTLYSSSGRDFLEGMDDNDQFYDVRESAAALVGLTIDDTFIGKSGVIELLNQFIEWWTGDEVGDVVRYGGLPQLNDTGIRILDGKVTAFEEPEKLLTAQAEEAIGASPSRVPILTMSRLKTCPRVSSWSTRRSKHPIPCRPMKTATAAAQQKPSAPRTSGT